MSSTLYIKDPGGAILAHADGEHVNYTYGQRIDLTVLSAAQKNHLGHISTTKKPAQAPPSPGDANLNAALIEANNVNTTASPIPGNYSELDEDQAVRLISNVRDPQVQAVLIAFEMSTLNREKVIAAADDEVRNEAEVRAIVAEYEAEQANTAGEAPSGVPAEPVGATPADTVPVAPPIPGAAAHRATPPPTS